MPYFSLKPDGYTAAHGWRPLRLPKVAGDPLLKGWDVYDLQCKLTYLGHTIDTDGVFGPITQGAVKAFQAAESPVAGPVDGIAGSQTQVTLGARAALHGDLPDRVRGQMEKESSNLCGIYTPVYTEGEARGFQDTGPVQMNTKYHTTLSDNFDVRKAVPFLVATIRKKHTDFVNLGTKDARAWEAAQGWWNSQVLATRYAKGQAVPASFLEYIDAVTSYA
jgi:Putative peptidoglycan binding domain